MSHRIPSRPARRATERRTIGAGTLLMALAAACHADSPDPSVQPGSDTVQSVTIIGNLPARPYAVGNASAGTKTDTPLMETPVNIQVVDQQVMKDQAATSLDRILTNVSGVISNTQDSFGQLSIIIRGFDTGSVQYVDGMRIYDHFGAGLLQTTDIDRVEVLKGPAAILYGASEPGGIVNSVTKRPLDQPLHEYALTAGSWRHGALGFDVNEPLGPDHAFAVRIDGGIDYSRSFRDGVWTRTAAISPSLTWHLTTATEATIKYFYEHNPTAPDNGQVVPLLADGTLVAIPRNVNLNDPGATWEINDLSRLQLEFKHRFNDEWAIAAKATEYDARGRGISVNGGGFYAPGTAGNPYPGWNYQIGYPQYAFGMASYQDATEKTRYATVDLNGHFDAWGARHSVLLGADFTTYAEPSFFESGQSTPDQLPIVPVDRTVYTPVVLDPGNLTRSNSTANDYGVYLQDQAKIGSFVLLAGLRYQHWHDNSQWQDVYGATNVANGAAGFYPGSSYITSATTGRLGAVWQARPWLSVYAMYAGGFDPNFGYDYQHHTLQATGAVDTEGGVKFETPDHRLQASLGVFDLTKTNLAETDFIHLDPVSNQYDYQYTIGKVRSRGVEFDLRGQIQPNWDLIATYALVDARVSYDPNSIATTGIPSSQGNVLGNSPEHAGSVWTTYRFGVDGNGGWMIGAGFVARSSTLDANNVIRTPGYLTTNLVLGRDWRIGGCKLTAQLNVNNVGNVAYYTNSSYDYGTPGNSTYAGVTYGNPREVVGTLRLEY